MHTFDYHQQITEVVLVGLGGSGSQLARSLCRIIYDMRQRRQHTPIIRFVDFDRVEAKNVGRQMFTEADIGQYKCEVLARRFNLALGLGITWHPEPFDAERHTGRYGTLLLGCVDNHLARLELSRVDGIWLDAGNHHASGQVSLGNTSNRANIERCIKNNQYTHLPNAALIFPQLLEPEPTLQPLPAPIPMASCAELVESASQALLINDMIGIIASEYVYKLLNRLPVLSFLTYVDTESLSMRSVPITLEQVKAMLGN